MLPYKFKFITIATDSITYTATIHGDTLQYEWHNGKGTSFWDLNHAEKLVASGKWIITEIIQQTKEKTMQQNTIKQMEQTVEQLLAKAEELKQQIEAAKKEEDVWPKIGDKYWVVDCIANVVFHYWQGDTYDESAMKFGNTYKTKEDAENYVQKRLVQVELETLAKKAWKESCKQTDWTDEHQSKHHIYYDYTDKEFYVSANIAYQYIGQVFFPTKESASNAVKTIGEERLKKLFM